MYAKTGEVVAPVAQFLASGAAATGLTVTCKLWEIRSDGSKVPNDTTGTTKTVTELGGGGYFTTHTMAGDGVPIAVFSTAGTADQTAVMTGAFSLAQMATILADTAELQTNQGNWLTATGFSTHSAADVWAVSVRSLSTFGTLVADVWAYALASMGAETTVGGRIKAFITSLVYTTPPTADAIGTDAASKILATPANKLATDASGNVIASNMRGTDNANTVAPLDATATAAATQFGMTAQGATPALFAELDGLAPAIADLATDLGPDECTLTLSSVLGDELEGAAVYVSSDLAGTVRSPVKTTDDAGRAKFNLIDGDPYYVWITSTGYTGTNPTAFTAVKDV